MATSCGKRLNAPGTRLVFLAIAIASGRCAAKKNSTVSATGWSISSAEIKRWACRSLRRKELALHFTSLLAFAAVIDWMQPRTWF